MIQEQTTFLVSKFGIPTLVPNRTGGQVGVFYMNANKAFNKLDHDVLLQKLHHFGFPQSLLKLFAFNLSRRKQFTPFWSADSFQYGMLLGVPQGLASEPLLFVLMVDDNGNVIEPSEFLVFADDQKWFSTVFSAEECGELKANMDSVSGWC